MSSQSAKDFAASAVTSAGLSNKFRPLLDEWRPEDAQRVDNLRHKMKAVWKVANSYAGGVSSNAASKADKDRPKEHPPVFVGEDESGCIYAYVACFGPDGSAFLKESQFKRMKLVFAARGIRTFVFACEAFVSTVKASDFEKGNYDAPSKSPTARDALVVIAVDGTEQGAPIELGATADLIAEPRRYARMVFAPRATDLSSGLSSLVTFGKPAPKDVAEDIEKALDMVPTILTPEQRRSVPGNG